MCTRRTRENGQKLAVEKPPGHRRRLPPPTGRPGVEQQLHVAATGPDPAAMRIGMAWKGAINRAQIKVRMILRL